MAEADLPRITSIEVEAPYKLHITWADGQRAVVDMTGVIAGFEPFTPLKNQELFAQAEVVGLGSGIEWPNGLDFSADSLAHIAQEQTAMSGRDFELWQKAMDLSLQETADLFGVTVSTVKNYRKLDALPIAVQIACRAMREKPQILYAHFRPRVNGRPRKRMEG